MANYNGLMTFLLSFSKIRPFKIKMTFPCKKYLYMILLFHNAYQNKEKPSNQECTDS